MRAYVLIGYVVLECTGTLINDGDDFRVAKGPELWGLNGQTIMKNNFFVTMDGAYIRLEQVMIAAAREFEELSKRCLKQDIEYYDTSAKEIRAMIAGVREFDMKFMKRLS